MKNKYKDELTSYANKYLNSEFNKLVINSDKPYNIQFCDYYGNKTKYLSIDSEKLNKIIQIMKTN